MCVSARDATELDVAVGRWFYVKHYGLGTGAVQAEQTRRVRGPL